MAAPAPPHVSAPMLSQKQRRAAQRKERRKRKRQALAQARECGLNNGAICTPEEEIKDEEDEDNDFAEAERLQLHEEWLEKERLAQEEFRLKLEREEAARKRKEEEERMIKLEWEAQQKREQEEKEQKQQEKQGREEAVQKMLDEAENQLQLDNGGPWMNPEAPVSESSENFGTERDVANCPFFLKTGACRFGDRCSRRHTYPTASTTLMIRGMFKTFGMEESRRDDYDTDAWLEHSEDDLQESFLEFYHDVLPEFQSIGKVMQFKVSCNYEPHLRGNVYVQFETEEQCKEALFKFNGRWYAGRQLHCEMCPVTRWKNAICGLFDRQRCPKGKHCNFLHVFRNPGNEFWEADRDLSPDRSVRGSRRGGWHSERDRDRSRRQRHCSRSPPRSERSHSRREGDRQRSRSRERRPSQQHRDDKWSSRSRRSDRRNDWYLSRSRDRSRSRSRDREPDRLRNRSRDRDRYRSRSEERDGRDKDTDAHRKVRERSRSSSREEERHKRSREKSPDKNDKPPNDVNNRHKRHKQSKKSKKKSKKKHKKKSHQPEETTSTGESEKEETAENLRAASPGQEMNSELIEKNNDLDESQCADSEKKFSPEANTEQSHTEIKNEPS
ncbi:U2 small nuclear ribonucleoprotein auxiliary factor 35 kDa subunit-related protein 2 [Acanthopagrus latus]|uniref:U2 small nuclear ribonucleoprotein auxiliary factor 35 kDa subunit-related protein 2 n=1 Tax=Acanthopagrus latus TaxID=8177 RepID=UPI00187CCC5F|nr:U2 small nuclear ribonucleoprotein auxiliary factor 35 kDa subunit-related protein 2 [Acanthopagrus latus]